MPSYVIHSCITWSCITWYFDTCCAEAWNVERLCMVQAEMSWKFRTFYNVFNIIRVPQVFSMSCDIPYSTNFGGFGGSLPIRQSFIHQKVVRSCELKYWMGFASANRQSFLRQYSCSPDSTKVLSLQNFELYSIYFALLSLRHAKCSTVYSIV